MRKTTRTRNSISQTRSRRKMAYAKIREGKKKEQSKSMNCRSNKTAATTTTKK